VVAGWVVRQLVEGYHRHGYRLYAPPLRLDPRRLRRHRLASTPCDNAAHAIGRLGGGLGLAV